MYIIHPFPTNGLEQWARGISGGNERIRPPTIVPLLVGISPRTQTRKGGEDSEAEKRV